MKIRSLRLAAIAWILVAACSVGNAFAAPGSLYWRIDSHGWPVEAPAVETDIDLAISGPILRARVRQVFVNPHGAWMEGIYVFPLPPDSAVDRLTLRIGERVIEGRIEERRAARQAYDEARAQGQHAGLIDQDRPNVFTASIANIAPGESVAVELEFQATTRLENGVHEARLPLVVAPRYIPGAPLLDGGGRGAPTLAEPDAPRITPPAITPSAGRAHRVRFDATIDAGAPIAELESASHRIDWWAGPSGRVNVALAEDGAFADRDLVLRWRLVDSPAPRASVLVEDGLGLHHALITLLPPRAVAADVMPPREMILVIDTSGSMGGESIRQAKAALGFALGRLAARDRFNIIQFNSTTEALFPAAVPADRRALDLARRYVDRLVATGGTEMMPAIALALDNARDPTRLRQVVFVTDGEVGNEDALFKLIEGRRGDTRLFTVGIGSAPNGWFMTRAARIGQGSHTHIDRIQDVDTRMRTLFDKLDAPALTDLRARVIGAEDAELLPEPLPDLYAGEPVEMLARWRGRARSIEIEGRLGDRPWQASLALDDAATGPGVARLWARARLEALAHRDDLRADPAGLRRASVEVALAYGLVGRFTSLVAVDEIRARPAELPLVAADVPLNLPARWSAATTFGATVAQPVNLPQTASWAPPRMIGGVSLLLAGLIVLARARRAP